MDEQRFQILSLDGGGIKGLFSAAVLAAIEEDLDIRIVDHFDLITGTSTGGIIALGLGIGMRPREIVEFYLSKGPKIFPSGFRVKWQHWLKNKFAQEPLKAALENCFKDKRLADCTKRIVIPSYNLGEDDVYIFRTPHAERLKRDWKVPLWKVALATSAAPTFFPCSRHVDSLRLIDGGVWANNPTMVGVVEAYGTLNIPLEAIHVFSVGTSDAVNHRHKKLNTGGLLSWAKTAADVIMRGQSIGVHNQASFLLGKERVERWNPQVASDEFSLDGVHKADDLVGKAAHVSRILMPRFQDKFVAHTAAEYEPLYS
ncbi:CBASS cGAMP-activated phospholipase [Novipirellula rosea]|uniref:CBASS cGAMP-activated phospholipase n=1 Tax=Novipirellula rosea TaxID=1031540 RepID=A0ABP8M6E9_9BACT